MHVGFCTARPFHLNKDHPFKPNEIAVTVLSGIAGMAFFLIGGIFTFLLASYLIRKYKAKALDSEALPETPKKITSVARNWLSDSSPKSSSSSSPSAIKFSGLNESELLEKACQLTLEIFLNSAQNKDPKQLILDISSDIAHPLQQLSATNSTISLFFTSYQTWFLRSGCCEEDHTFQIEIHFHKDNEQELIHSEQKTFKQSKEHALFTKNLGECFNFVAEKIWPVTSCRDDWIKTFATDLAKNKKLWEAIFEVNLLEEIEICRKKRLNTSLDSSQIMAE